MSTTKSATTRRPLIQLKITTIHNGPLEKNKLFNNLYHRACTKSNMTCATTKLRNVWL